MPVPVGGQRKGRRRHSRVVEAEVTLTVPAAVILHRDDFQRTVADDERTLRQLLDGLAQPLHDLPVSPDADATDLLHTGHGTHLLPGRSTAPWP